ncbi:amidase domain-containing protein [Enterococcus sp. BWB1-3]|uniref:amidase domain-containing protein n=1 Tax=Enterococcus sp. BWB1-3 TaxID=2787713 RepID=UPI001923ABBC|nr:amidase domain-containing protein [Enterococcus sp. BWB1-3]MBL1229989.1 amidase domain-containing protein [Enterococcus sp. BWB1-3]
MKKNFVRVLCAILGIFAIFITGTTITSANELDGTDIVTAVKEGIQENKIDFNLERKLSDVQQDLLSIIKEKNGKEFETQLEGEYFRILEAIESGNLLISDSDEKNIMYSEFSSIYLTRIASILPVNPTDEEVAEILQEKEVLLERTFNDIRTENIALILSTEDAPKARMARAAFNVTNATKYARDWWNRRNVLFPLYESDCTNFASQIAFYGGKPLRNSPNASGMTWTHTAGVTASSPWKLAHNFMVFWTADGYSTRQFSTKNEAQGYVREGDFIGYFKKNTFEISHIAYVSKKSGNTAYITQHTTDRVDTTWNSINTDNYSAFIVLRF